MSTSFCDTLRNVNSGRSDWKVKVRVIRQWRGSTNTGIVFKGYNIMLLDAKNCRMHAYIPQSIEHKMTRLIEEGKIYVIKNFNVKDYEAKDKFRAVHMDRQIVFTTDTVVKELEESEIFIPNNSFDLYQFSDLREQAVQVMYLTDVIGIINNKPEISRIPDKQVKIKFKITDGRTNINVTFWRNFAEEFNQAIQQHLEEPVIIIIASGRVTKFQDQIDICNYSPTKYYLNYDHHSVKKLRQLMLDPNFTQIKLGRLKKKITVCNINEILNLGKEFNQEEVICKVTIKSVEEEKDWKVYICTGCYMKTQLHEKQHYCLICKRFVEYPLKRFNVSTMVADHTGELKAVLGDREIRNLIHKFVEEVETEDEAFPKEIKSIERMDCTVKLFITSNNVEEKSAKFRATHIMKGFNIEQAMTEQEDTFQPGESSAIEPFETSVHLDDISQLQ